MSRYEDIDALNWSRLKMMRKSPKHFRYALDHGEPDKDTYRFGRLEHCLVYEPEEFLKRYLIQPRFHGGMKDDTALLKGYDGGREAKAEFDRLAAKTGLEVIELEAVENARRMAEAVRSDPVAGPILDGAYVEQTMTWTDPFSGRKCKGRMDQVNGRLGDMKRCSDLARFENSVERYGYLGQLAWYSDGLAANGILVDDLPVLIAVEPVEPYDVRVLEVSEDDLDAGRMLYRGLLERLAGCEASNEWPGISGGKMERLRRPAWAVADTETLELTMGGMPLEMD